MVLPIYVDTFLYDLTEACIALVLSFSCLGTVNLKIKRHHFSNQMQPCLAMMYEYMICTKYNFYMYELDVKIISHTQTST
jgi:hypothetical protein